MDPNHGLGIQRKVRLLLGLLLGSLVGIQGADAMLPTDWIPVTDEKQVSRSDDWQVDRFRFAETRVSGVIP